MKQLICILHNVLQVVVLSSVWIVLLYLMAMLSSCHALVIADKLVYQGTLGKKQANVEFVDSSTVVRASDKSLNVTPP